MDNWAPRSRQPMNLNGLFPVSNGAVTISKSTPMQRQRELDGTPITRGNVTRLQPPGERLIIKSACKADLPQEDDEVTKLAKAQAVVKAFMEQ